MKELSLQETTAISGGISPAYAAYAVAFTVMTLTVASYFHDQTESLKSLTKNSLFKGQS